MTAANVIELLEGLLFPGSVLVLMAVVLMLAQLMDQYHAARHPAIWPATLPTEDPEILRYSTRYELWSGCFQLGKVVVLLWLSSSLFLPWLDLVTEVQSRMLVIRFGLVVLLFLVLANTIVRWRYWRGLRPRILRALANSSR